MAITFPPGSVGTGTDPSFHRRGEDHIFTKVEITLYGNFTAPCLDCRYDAIFIIGHFAVCGPGYDHLSGKAGIVSGQP